MELISGGKPAKVSFSAKGWIAIAALALGGPGSTWAVMRVEINALNKQTEALHTQTQAMKDQSNLDRERLAKLETSVQVQREQYGEFVGVLKSLVRVEQSVEDIKDRIKSIEAKR